mgnify:CR=1 FL=1
MDGLGLGSTEVGATLDTYCLWFAGYRGFCLLHSNTDLSSGADYARLPPAIFVLEPCLCVLTLKCGVLEENARDLSVSRGDTRLPEDIFRRFDFEEEIDDLEG